MKSKEDLELWVKKQNIKAIVPTVKPSGCLIFAILVAQKNAK